MTRDRAEEQQQRIAEYEATIEFTRTNTKGPRGYEEHMQEQLDKRNEEEEKRKTRRRGENPYMDFIDPPGDDNARLVNQNGLFTRTQDGEDIETYVRRMFAGRNNTILVKITIPNSERETTMCALNQMNINHATLFPDLYGASTFSNMRWTIPGYADIHNVPIPQEFVD